MSASVLGPRRTDILVTEKPFVKQILVVGKGFPHQELLPDQLLSTFEASQILGVAAHRLVDWRRRNPNRCGGPPFVRLGKTQIRYRVSDVLAYIQSRVVQPGVPK